MLVGWVYWIHVNCTISSDQSNAQDYNFPSCSNYWTKYSDKQHRICVHLIFMSNLFKLRVKIKREQTWEFWHSVSSHCSILARHLWVIESFGTWNDYSGVLNQLKSEVGQTSYKKLSIKITLHRLNKSSLATKDLVKYRQHWSIQCLKFLACFKWLYLNHDWQINFLKIG